MFAARVEVEKELIINAGSRAIILVNGGCQEVIGPGKWTVQSLRDRFTENISSPVKYVTAILVDIGDVEIPFHIDGLLTKDRSRVSIACQIVVRLDKPIDFLRNTLKNNPNYTLSELQAMLRPEITNITRGWMHRFDVEELNAKSDLTDVIEQAMQLGLNQTFERNGLRFVRLRVVDVVHSLIS